MMEWIVGVASLVGHRDLVLRVKTESAKQSLKEKPDRWKTIERTTRR